uniref:Tubulin-specific chaperone cofactor E-like protein-like n=1 Tax=Saccoglossus kowalevskii TaxID=10224 RepID=A0ABM0LZ29_SACKO|nr:PREDICTED: tubulin-specific chaperone cofactor E-like protein-like [Saccoglossus kowalevskii]
MAYFTVNLDSDSVFDDADQELSTGSVGADDGDSPTNVSFVQALKHKYCEESLTSLYKNTSRKRSSSAELGFLQNVVLGGFEITCAGLPKEGLVTLCPNVVDLDLAKNELDCWSEVLAIMTELPCLKFVNLSFNKLKNDKKCINSYGKSFPLVENLVLNGTEISWQDMAVLAKLMPRLKELHLCGNGYNEVEYQSRQDFLDAFSSVQCIRLNNNNIVNLPRIKILNGSEVSGNEREKAEIHYVRYFADEESPPNRYHELTKIYGKLEKNYKLYMRKPFKRDADIKIMYNGKCVDEIHVKLKDAIGKLKSTCSNLTSLHRRHIRMFHMSKNVVDDNGEPVFQELFLESLPMSRFDIMDGDEIYVEKKQFEYYR